MNRKIRGFRHFNGEEMAKKLLEWVEDAQKVIYSLNDTLDLLEYEWGQGDGMPEGSAARKYLRACQRLDRKPKFSQEER